MNPQQIPLRSDLESGGRFYRYRGLLLFILAGLTIWLTFAFLKSLIMGAIFATVLFPVMGFFDRAKWTAGFPRALRAAIVTIVFTLVIFIPFGLLVFAGLQAVLEKVQTLDPAVLASGRVNVTGVINGFGLHDLVDRVYDWLPISRDQAQTYLGKGLSAATTYGTQFLQNLVVTFPARLLSTFILILTLFFLLIDGPRVVQFLRANSVFNYPQTNHLIQMTKALCNSVIVATIVSGGVQATVVALVCLFTNTKGPLLFTFLTFASSFFPVIGTTPVVLFLAIQAFSSGNTTNGIVWLIAVPVVGTVDNIVRPYVLKGGAELHPLVGFVAAFGALNMIGFYGLFIGPIVVGLFFTLLPMVTRSIRLRPSFKAR